MQHDDYLNVVLNNSQDSSARSEGYAAKNSIEQH